MQRPFCFLRKFLVPPLASCLPPPALRPCCLTNQVWTKVVGVEDGDRFHGH